MKNDSFIATLPAASAVFHARRSLPMIYHPRSDKVEIMNRWMTEHACVRERNNPYARGGGDSRDSGRRFNDQHRRRSRHFSQVQSEQRARVHVATVPEVMRSLSGMAPDDNLRQIAEAQVELTQAALLTAAAKEALDRVMAKQGSINEKELERGHPDPRKLDTLFGQVVNYANHDPLSHELHKMRDKIARSPPLRATIKDYLKVEVRRPRLERRPCRDRGD